MIEGLFEAHLHVTNLERSAEFYEKVLGLQLYHHEESRRANFYYPGGYGKTMIGVWETEPEKWVREHISFRVSIENMKKSVAWLKERGVKVRSFLNDGTEDLQVACWMPAVSIFFYDPDGHSLEFIAMLPDEPKPELGVVTWEQWEQLHGRKLADE